MCGRNDLGRLAMALLGMALLVPCSRAATFLGRSTETRSLKDDDASYTVSSAEDEEGDGGNAIDAVSFFLPEEVPEDWIPGRLRASAEIGYQHWIPSSSSGQYHASYDIDPVTTTLFESAVRVKGWVFLADYTTSLSDPDQMRNLLAQVSRIDPGVGAWWSLYAETGSVKGEAETEDELGNPVAYPVDTEWNRIGIELRTYKGTAIGLVYEDLTLPTILTFNNEQVAFAIFDDDAQARTLSISFGYDRARHLLNAFKEGGAWAWALEGSVGMGWLSYSKDEAQGMVEQQGYEFESIDLLLAGAVDGRLGYTFSKEFLDTQVQCFVGARLRASGWMNLAGESPEDDAVGLDTSFGLFTPGVFARLSFQW
ncbi:hypothetical protein PDESU_05151 [Pontiella desulfatans]|uniref:Secreted protein n=2 Tax=Pontiella desulfatans TaxID=2750659 RepID=A0A6C2U932_PONDE|nr:hypothetical protein PDESU_05151 [Pontiella desulfatans]